MFNISYCLSLQQKGKIRIILNCVVEITSPVYVMILILVISSFTKIFLKKLSFDQESESRASSKKSNALKKTAFFVEIQFRWKYKNIERAWCKKLWDKKYFRGKEFNVSWHAKRTRHFFVLFLLSFRVLKLASTFGIIDEFSPRIL